MILSDRYENARLFGANIQPYLITAKVAWINRNASRVIFLRDIKNPEVEYKVNLGRKFSRQATDMIVEHIYLPIVK